MPTGPDSPSLRPVPWCTCLGQPPQANSWSRWTDRGRKRRSSRILGGLRIQDGRPPGIVSPFPSVLRPGTRSGSTTWARRPLLNSPLRGPMSGPLGRQMGLGLPIANSPVAELTSPGPPPMDPVLRNRSKIRPPSEKGWGGHPGRAAGTTFWTRDGAWIVTDGLADSTRNDEDIFAVSTGSDRTRKPVVSTPAQEETGAVSPDGKWIAYGSDEGGQWQVYVRPFLRTGGTLAGVDRRCRNPAVDLELRGRLRRLLQQKSGGRHALLRDNRSGHRPHPAVWNGSILSTTANPHPIMTFPGTGSGS